MCEREIVVIGGGAAGFFAAIACAEARPEARVTILEKGSNFLSKVKISGGGRCNVTHGCFEPKELSGFYPRGGTALLGPFHRFQCRDTMNWFESRGVALKIERDGRVFPESDSSQTIIDCLLKSAHNAGIRLMTSCDVKSLTHTSASQFSIGLANGKSISCDRVMLATGGCRTLGAGALAASLGHTIEPPVPSLFTFEIQAPWLRELAGISVEPVEISVHGTGLRECGPILLTHTGVSGPAVLRLSAWGARILHDRNYSFPLRIRWLPRLTEEQISAHFQKQQKSQPSRLVGNSAMPPIPGRLWEQLIDLARISRITRWAEFSRLAQHQLIQQLCATELPVSGKSLNRDEFVTCGGVKLAEVNFKTLESRIYPSLYFGGELLDIDGLTGGFNFQAAWTTGWIAGHAMAND